MTNKLGNRGLITVLIILALILSTFTIAGEETNPTKINVIDIDIKVKNKNMNSVWTEKIDVDNGDTVSFKIDIKNSNTYELTQISVIDTLPPKNKLKLLDGTILIDNPKAAFEIIDNQIVIYFETFNPGETATIVYDMLAVGATDSEGISNQVSISSNLDSSYYEQIETLKIEIDSKKLKCQDLESELSSKSEEITTLENDIQLLSEQKESINSKISVYNTQIENLSSQIVSLEAEKSLILNEIEQLTIQKQNIENTI